MKTLSILQPWASLVAHGHKKIETRSWNTKYRGELLIHASASPVSKIIKKMPLSFWDLIKEVGLLTPDLPFGAIIGKVNLVHVVESSYCFSGNEFEIEDFSKDSTGNRYPVRKWDISEQELAFGDYSPGRFGWLLSDPVLFDKPIPCKGKLGIWNFDVLENYRRLSPITDHKQLTQMFKPLELE